MMQMPIRIAAIFAVVFAGICLWFAIDGLSSPDDVNDPDRASGGRSFAFFWGFLALVGFAIAWFSWKLGGRRADEKDN